MHLLPYTLARHLAIGLQLGSAALVAWSVVTLGVVAGTPWSWSVLGLVGWRELDGTLFLCAQIVAVTTGSLAIQGAIDGRSHRWRLGWGALAGLVALPGFVATHVVTSLSMQALFASPLLDDPSLVALRTHLPGWLAAGTWAGIGTLAARSLTTVVARRFTWARDGAPTPPRRPWAARGLSVLAHVGGGLAAGGLAAAAWHAIGHHPSLGGDYYVASAVASVVFGATCGLLFWGVPDTPYQGYVRVLSPARFGRRIPVSAGEEVFVGHYPRGLDLYLPEADGVAELHCSIAIDEDGTATVRGLSQAATLVRRPLETIDLRYDPTRAAPLETVLRSEDRIVLGDAGRAELEFVMLPRTNP